MSSEDALGDMGLWQLRAVVLVSLVKVPSAWFMASILFIAPTPLPGHYWCANPGLQPLHYTHQGRRDPCHFHDATTDKPGRFLHSDNISVVACTEFQFRDGPHDPFSIVTQWHLVCPKEVLVSVSQLFYLLGMLIGGIICSLLLSRFSPRRLVLAAMLLQLGAGISTAYAPFFELHLALRFLSAVGFANLIACGYLICTDITRGTWRTVVGACYENMWSVGVITLPCLSSLFLDWRDLQVTMALSTMPLLILYRWMPDSPRWLLDHGYAEEALKILKEAALCNGRDMPLIEIPKKTCIPRSARSGWWRLFRPPNSRLKVCCLHVLWATTVVCYYGGLLNVRNLGDKVLTNTVIAGVAEILGVLIALRLLWCNKKWLTLGLFLLTGGVAALLCWAVPLDAPWTKNGALVALAMLDRVPIACSLTVLQVGSPQLLHQEFRPVAMLSCVTFARTFLLSAPFIAATAAMYGEYVSLSIFGIITVVGGFASLLLEFCCQRQTKYKCGPEVLAADKSACRPGIIQADAYKEAGSTV